MGWGWREREPFDRFDKLTAGKLRARGFLMFYGQRRAISKTKLD